MNHLWDYLTANERQIRDWTATTLWLAAGPLALALALALPCGWLAHRYRWAHAPLVSGLGVLYTVPSLVMFLTIPDVLGTRILDPLNVVIALSVYCLALLVRSVADALDSVPADVLATAAALGHTALQRLVSVQLPLALPVLGAGLRVAAVSNVSLVSVASVIGTSQLGQLFLAGDNTRSLPPLVLGLICFTAIALAFDAVIVGLIRLATPWRAAVTR
ncbi:ABC transporter permease subunit [Streptomyces sp. NPDC005708]|uniref:ABC transporter permease n=1 Tax=Streptomyces sp. NPDC005708 TaxID=3154564 RepID=UPI0033E1ACF7